MNQHNQRIHLVLLGDSAVGKTVFSILLQQKKYQSVLCQTISTEMFKHIVNNTEFVIYDIAGCQRYLPLQIPFLKKATVALIFDDATKSKPDVNWYTFLRQHNSDAKVFHIRVKSENTNAKCGWSYKHGINLGNVELTKEPNLDALVLEKILHHLRPATASPRRWLW